MWSTLLLGRCLIYVIMVWLSRVPVESLTETSTSSSRYLPSGTWRVVEHAPARSVTHTAVRAWDRRVSILFLIRQTFLFWFRIRGRFWFRHIRQMWRRSISWPTRRNWHIPAGLFRRTGKDLPADGGAIRRPCPEASCREPWMRCRMRNVTSGSHHGWNR